MKFFFSIIKVFFWEANCYTLEGKNGALYGYTGVQVVEYCIVSKFLASNNIIIHIYIQSAIPAKRYARCIEGKNIIAIVCAVFHKLGFRRFFKDVSANGLVQDFCGVWKKHSLS